MINLYQILNLPIDATTVEINTALRQYQQNPLHNPKIITATQQWLLVASTRQRYNHRLRTAYPDFFDDSEYDIEEIHDEDEYETESQCEYDFFDTYTPKLWSPTGIVVAAALISPVFGAILTTLNWRELGRYDLAQRDWSLAKKMILPHFVAVVLTVVSGVKSLMLLCPILMTAAWWFQWQGNQQWQFVHDQMNAQFVTKSWKLPLGLAAAGYFAYLVAAFFLLLFAVLLGVAHPDFG